jgi:hypothetical protein
VYDHQTDVVLTAIYIYDLRASKHVYVLEYTGCERISDKPKNTTVQPLNTNGTPSTYS